VNSRHNVTSSIRRISPTPAPTIRTVTIGKLRDRRLSQAATATMTAQPLLSKGLRGSRQLRNARGRYLSRCLDAVRAVGRNLRRARMIAFHEGMTPPSRSKEPPPALAAEFWSCAYGDVAMIEIATMPLEPTVSQRGRVAPIMGFLG
jgi:hypothetical protein